MRSIFRLLVWSGIAGAAQATVGFRLIPNPELQADLRPINSILLIGPVGTISGVFVCAFLITACFLFDPVNNPLNLRIAVKATIVACLASLPVSFLLHLFHTWLTFRWPGAPLFLFGLLYIPWLFIGWRCARFNRVS